MDYLKLDKVRKSTTPLQLDVVEAFAQGRLSRREFIQRGTIVGLRSPITAVIAACGGGQRRRARRLGRGSAAPAGAAGGPSASPPAAPR
jgi:hypothetical protein